MKWLILILRLFWSEDLTRLRLTSPHGWWNRAFQASLEQMLLRKQIKICSNLFWVKIPWKEKHCGLSLFSFKWWFHNNTSTVFPGTDLINIKLLLFFSLAIIQGSEHLMLPLFLHLICPPGFENVLLAYFCLSVRKTKEEILYFLGTAMMVSLIQDMFSYPKMSEMKFKKQNKTLFIYLIINPMNNYIHHCLVQWWFVPLTGYGSVRIFHLGFFC